MFKQNKFLKAQKEIQDILGKKNVLTDELSKMLHSYDCGLGRTTPDAVLKITNTALVEPVVKVLSEYRVPFVQRSAATNHVGGCVALQAGVVLNLYPLNKIIEINTKEGYALVEAGVVNLDLQKALAEEGFFYAPDPASEKICTIGGNAALNAGGARGMKYGATAENVLKAEIVTPEGKTLILDRSQAGPNLLGLMIGSEGTLGIITKLWLKILAKKFIVKTMLATFNSIDDAARAVADTAKEGIVPRCIEAMDKTTTETVEAFADCGYPTDAEALLLIETQGPKKTAEEEISKIEEICKKNNSVKTIMAKNAAHTEALWKGRRGGYAAMARLAPNVFVEDGTVPVHNLPEALKKTRDICDEYNLKTGLFFHAGDGNLHPNVVFDSRKKIETNIVKKAGKEMLKVCADLGGTISGEHGIGIEKRAGMSYMYSERELGLFRKIKKALDPADISNPDKVIPIASEGKGADRAEPSAYAGEFKNIIKSNSEIVISGCGTQISVKNTKIPQINTQKLHKIVEKDTKNNVIVVESGAKISDIALELEKDGFYMRAPSYKGSAGGLYSTGLSSEFNDSVIGVEIMTADGEIMRFGGKFTKNAAGYSIVRLLAGSYGAYAVVLKMIIRIFKDNKKIKTEKIKITGFKPNIMHKKLKKALDPDDKLNKFVFEGAENA
ncbi:glycolate oxidase [Parelusimicrobium proximum]|uniref:FAD-binding oxidoreductase n=1 Tax=Parelusimicrobium proximum TaxID=3228953 RepID=UPI003D182EAE